MQAAEKVISREEAIESIVQNEINCMSAEQRAEELYCFHAEGWADHPNWHKLPASLQKSLSQKTITNPDDKCLDAAFQLPMSHKYIGAKNEYLLRLLNNLLPQIQKVVGNVIDLFACPCCGLKNLDEQASYDICRVCWWEDDGQDNHNASIAMGGPNENVSLTIARINVLKHGIYNPSRADLIPFQEDNDKYVSGREFVVDERKGKIFEMGAEWRENL